MVYLIDTHVLIWRISGIAAIDDPGNTLFLSKASLWEMAIKIGLEKLKMSIPFNELKSYLISKNIFELDYSHEDLETLIQLPKHHHDPFDRLIISQAINRGLTIITDDNKFQHYSVSLLKA
jgi:PIN domain nuclease of toxin-antitoxin system